MPDILLSLEVIMRAECVEQAQAGDKCDFTGTLIVVPDVSQLATPGCCLSFCLSASAFLPTCQHIYLTFS